MIEHQFKAYMEAARTLGGDYADGYRRGLRRHYHGEAFGEPGEHEKWMVLEGSRQELGEGYRDGFSGNPPRGFHGGLGNQNAAGGEMGGNLNIRTEEGEKPLWVKAANQSEHKKLSAWVRANLNRAAREELGL